MDGSAGHSNELTRVVRVICRHKQSGDRLHFLSPLDSRINETPVSSSSSAEAFGRSFDSLNIRVFALFTSLTLASEQEVRAIRFFLLLLKADSTKLRSSVANRGQVAMQIGGQLKTVAAFSEHQVTRQKQQMYCNLNCRSSMFNT